MKLYFLTEAKQYVHRQADVPRGADFKIVDVPTDLKGLMDFLNLLWQAHQIDLDRSVVGEIAEVTQVYIDDKPIEVDLPRSAPVPTFEQQLDVEEAIQRATPQQLAKYAENVCWRIKELSAKL